MAAIITTRFQVKDKTRMMSAIKRGKLIIENQGAEVRWHQVFTGAHVGEWVVTIRYPDWVSQAKGREALDGDADYKAVMAEVMESAEMMGRDLLVGIDL